MATKFGYFLIADISGYTQYLSESELEHAQQTLTALLNLIIKQTKPPLIISRLAGDAVISYGLRDAFVSGQTFLEMIEDTYVRFRHRVELMVRNTTCPCNACRNIGGLDLKFFVHYGEFSVQRLDAHDELVGSDVNLIHRLLKNSVTESIGSRAYALYTDAAIRQLGLEDETEGLIAHSETYEHLGEVKSWIKDMHPVWEVRRDAEQMQVSEENLLFEVDTTTTSPLEAVWDHMIRPEDFTVLLGADRVQVSKRRGGRVSLDSVYQCFHGDGRTSRLVVVGWTPFERVTLQFSMPLPLGEVGCLVEVSLEAVAGTTRITEAFAKTQGSVLARVAGDAALRSREASFKNDLQNFAALVEAEIAASGAVLQPAEIAEATIAAAARESLSAERPFDHTS